MSITQEVRKQVSTYILGGFSLVVGLAWNDAIHGLIDYLYPLQQDSLPAKFIYAGLMTLVLVAVTLVLVRPTAPEAKKN